MIAPHEAFLIERIEVKHIFPKSGLGIRAAVPRAIALERDIRHRIVVNDRLQVRARQVGFVGAHFLHHKVASRRVHEPLELRTVVSVRVGNLNAGYDVGFRSAHQVNLDPIVALHHFLVAVLCLNPLRESASHEAGRIDGKRCFDGLQRQTANFDQFFEKGCQCWVFKVARDGSIVRSFREITLTLRVSQVRDKATARERGVDLECAGKDHIGQGQARTPKALRRFFNSFAQFRQQRQEAFLRVGLRGVIGAPFLLVGFLDEEMVKDARAWLADAEATLAVCKENRDRGQSLPAQTKGAAASA